LSDPDDVKVVANDPQGAVLVHLGSSNFLERYKIYVTHLQEWRQQFNPVESVDLRYDRQIIVNPDLRGVKQAPLSTTAARVAAAAGVKPAALVAKISSRKAIAGPLRPAKTVAWKKPVRKHWTKAKAKPPLSAEVRRKAALPPVAPKPPVQSHAIAIGDLTAAKKKPSPAIGKDQGAQ
ncbi:MAG TPA: hypothetical protein VF758_05245, partial [Candidatus Acidoferrum sp.]